MTPFCTGALIATFRCDAPARCGACADERRVMGGDVGGRVYRGACTPLVAPFAGGVPQAGARTDDAPFAPACSRHFPLPRSRVAPVRRRARVVPGDEGGRETLIQAPRAVRLRRLPQCCISNRYALYTAVLIATFRCAAPARCGAFLDRRRIVAGAEGGFGVLG